MDLLDEIDFEWIGIKRDQFWKDRYNELVEFRLKHGHTRVPDKYDPAPQLHSWISSQRRSLKCRSEGKKHPLTEERVTLLESQGIEYQIRNVSTWEDRFNELKGKFIVLVVDSYRHVHIRDSHILTVALHIHYLLTILYPM